MAIKKKKDTNSDLADAPRNDKEDFANDLIRTLNKEAGERIAYNLSTDFDAPTIVKRWIPTGSIALDYIISNRRNGGVPEGRIIEIFGPPAIGKSHLALQITKNTQAMGGMVIYIDSENATNVELLAQLGVDVSKRFVYVEEKCTETVFTIMERAIMRAKELNKNVPVVIVWDSVAACSPKAELLGDYDKDTIGLQARVLAKGFRKITSIVGAESVTMVCLNQMKSAIGVMFGDPDTTPGGKAIPFHASVRLKLTSGTQIKDKTGEDVVGINVIATTIKNKVGSPRRKANFEIHFGIGIKEHEQLFDCVNGLGEITLEDGVRVYCGGNGTWKEFIVKGPDDKILHQKKFAKRNFDELLENPVWRPYIDELLDKAFIKKYDMPTLESELEAEVDLALDAREVRLTGVEGVNV